MVVVIQGLVILFAGALEHMFRPLARGACSHAGGGRSPTGMSELWLQSVLMLASTIRLAVPLVLCALAGTVLRAQRRRRYRPRGQDAGRGVRRRRRRPGPGSAWLGLSPASLSSACRVDGARLRLHHASRRSGRLRRGAQHRRGRARPTLADAWFGQAGRVPVTGEHARFGPIGLPFAEAGQVPIIGPVYTEAISGHNLIVYVAAVAVPVAAWVLYRTRFGLRVRAVGENPQCRRHGGNLGRGPALSGARWSTAVLTGVRRGLSVDRPDAGFIRDMSAGKGYLALAALIFGKWRPAQAMVGCMLFAFADAAQARLQGVALPGIGQIPTQAIQAIPYLLTILLLTGFVGRSVAPKAIGQPYVKER